MLLYNIKSVLTYRNQNNKQILIKILNYEVLSSNMMR